MSKFVNSWYNHGIETDPPPCLKSKTFYFICSGNIGCYYLGLMGTQWGAKHRSQIFFVAFWLSFIGLILILAAIACISADSTTIQNVPFFQGTFELVQGGVTSKVDYYAGIARMVFPKCEDSPYCPPSSMGWGDSSCDTYFLNCDKCKAANPGTVAFPVAMALFGQLGQLAGDLNRSTATHDLHCQKFIGLFSFILGMYGTLSTLSSFGNNCMSNLHTQPGVTANFTKHPGAALILLALATLLKVVDFAAHIVVPVPELDFWTPETPAKKEQEKAKITPTSTPTVSGAKVGETGGAQSHGIQQAQQREQEMINPVWIQSEV